MVEGGSNFATVARGAQALNDLALRFGSATARVFDQFSFLTGACGKRFQRVVREPLSPRRRLGLHPLRPR
jgi:hypothetical protein